MSKLQSAIHCKSPVSAKHTLCDIPLSNLPSSSRISPDGRGITCKRCIKMNSSAQPEITASTPVVSLPPAVATRCREIYERINSMSNQELRDASIEMAAMLESLGAIPLAAAFRMMARAQNRAQLDAAHAAGEATRPEVKAVTEIAKQVVASGDPVGALLKRCRNLMGPLGPDVIRRLRAHIDHPEGGTLDTWCDIMGIIITKKRGMSTVWQAMTNLNPAFPSEVTAGTKGRWPHSWPFPDGDKVLDAIGVAVREAGL